MSPRGLAVLGIGDPDNPLHMLKPNADGSINVDTVSQKAGLEPSDADMDDFDNPDRIDLRNSSARNAASADQSTVR